MRPPFLWLALGMGHAALAAFCFEQGWTVGGALNAYGSLSWLVSYELRARWP